MAKSGRVKKTTQQKEVPQNYLSKVSQEIESNQSKLSMVLGALILLVIGILIFNYFNKSKSDLGPAQQNETSLTEDVTSDNLPGKYTVKEGDTLFLIAEKYYQDGSRFEEIAKANNLGNVDTIETGQVLEIPKIELPTPTPNPSETPQPSPSETPAESPAVSPTPQSPTTSSPQKGDQLATGGGNNTVWGSNIEGNTYTVQEGDWLSTIAARAYGDIFAYTKIAEVNKIQNPDYIVPGMVLNIPR